jgi:DNA-binding LytR/AlgR family response regulator
MNQIKIGIVEDEMVIAAVIQDCLQKLGYVVVPPVSNYTEAVEMLSKEQPDLVILDIRIAGKKDGIDVAAHIREHYAIPLIFLSAFSDKETIVRAKKTTPNAYLLKPFTQNDLFAAIEIALTNFETQKNNSAFAPTSILIKDGYDLVAVLFSEIVYLVSADNYVQFFLANGKSVLTRSTMAEMINRIPSTTFCQISRSCIINLSFLSKVEKNQVLVKDIPLASSGRFRELLIDRLGQK